MRLKAIFEPGCLYKIQVTTPFFCGDVGKGNCQITKSLKATTIVMFVSYIYGYNVVLFDNALLWNKGYDHCFVLVPTQINEV